MCLPGIIGSKSSGVLIKNSQQALVQINRKSVATLILQTVPIQNLI